MCSLALPFGAAPRCLPNCHELAGLDGLVASATLGVQEVDDFLESYAQAVWKQLAIERNNNYAIKLSDLQKLHPFMQRHILVKWLIFNKVSFQPTESFFAEIMRFMFHAKKSKSHQLGTWVLHKSKDFIWVSNI